MFQSRRDGDDDIYVMSQDGTALTQLTHNTAKDRVPKWSPDGGRIVFRSERDGDSEIYVMNGDGSDQRRLTQFTGSQQYRPHWSPDGVRISFLSSDTVAGGNAGLYVVDSDGTDQVLVDSGYGGFLSHNPWSPDGKRLAYMKIGLQLQLQLWTADLEDASNTYLTDGVLPAWSPDGTTIAFGCLLDENWEVCTIAADGSGLTNLTKHESTDDLARWSPDGSKIAFWSWRDGVQELYVMNADGAEQTRLIPS